VDGIKQLEALLAESPGGLDDEIVRTIASLQVEGRICQPRQSERCAVARERMFAGKETNLTAEEMDELDRSAGAPVGTMRESWALAKERRSKA